MPALEEFNEEVEVVVTSEFLMLSKLLVGCLETPSVRTDGSLVLDQVTGVSAAGAGFFAHQSERCWSDGRWGHDDHVQLDHVVQSCRGFVSVPGPLQTVQRAVLWGVILALQSSDAVHVGVDNLGVVSSHWAFV